MFVLVLVVLLVLVIEGNIEDEDENDDADDVQNRFPYKLSEMFSNNGLSLWQGEVRRQAVVHRDIRPTARGVGRQAKDVPAQMPENFVRQRINEAARP